MLKTITYQSTMVTKVCTSSTLVFKRTCRLRWYTSKPSSLDMPSISENINTFKKLKYPESMFVHCKDVAKDIANTVCGHLNKSNNGKNIKLIEANSGPCLITQHVLKNSNYDVCLYENNFNAFKDYITAVQSYYGNRVTVNHGNLLLLWKLGFQDRMDRGDRVLKFLESIGVPQPWNQKDTSIKIIAALPNKKFLNYLIYSFMFQTGLMTYGRPEFYFLLTPSTFKRYSCKPVIDKKYYKTQTILFQTIFNIEFLKSYPRTAFFPPHLSKSSTVNVRYRELKEADDKYIVLAKVVGRQEILGTDCLTYDSIKPFWYFVKHHTISRKNFVIPMLEQWIPGCGPHFIAQGYTIFTQFGDLTPPQILGLFLKFINLPEFQDSPFLNSMESRIAKLLPSSPVTSDDSVVEQSEDNSLDFEEFSKKEND